MNARKRDERRCAFTLVELLTVLAIIGILFAISLSVAGLAKRASLKAQARSEVETLYNALHEYMLENGAYPDPGSNGVADAILIRPLVTNWLSSTNFNFADPWHWPYQYERRSLYSCRVFSFGPDTNNGTEDDIGSDR